MPEQNATTRIRVLCIGGAPADTIKREVIDVCAIIKMQLNKEGAAALLANAYLQSSQATLDMGSKAVP